MSKNLSSATVANDALRVNLTGMFYTGIIEMKWRHDMNIFISDNRRMEFENMKSHIHMQL